MKKNKWLWIVGLAVVGYLAYKWYQAKQNAAATSALNNGAAIDAYNALLSGVTTAFQGA